jgi:large-conductance mechanosensitive channel
MIISTIGNQFIDFLDFLKKRAIIDTGIAFIIAMQVNKIFLDFINELVNPLASKIVSQEFNKRQYEIFGLQIKIGFLFLSLLNFMVIMIFIFYLWKISETTPGLIGSVYSSISNSIKKIF